MTRARKRKKRKTANPARFLGRMNVAAGILLLLFLSSASFAGAQLENHDPFCASCHTEPESAYYQRTQADSQVDLAAAHARAEIRCIDCHSGQGLAGRAQAMLLGARDLTRYVSGNYLQPAVQSRPITDANCLKCHADYASAQVFENHYHFFLEKWQSVDQGAATCVDCHQSHNTDGNAEIKFLNEQHTLRQCDACHRVAGEG